MGFYHVLNVHHSINSEFSSFEPKISTLKKTREEPEISALKKTRKEGKESLKRSLMRYEKSCESLKHKLNLGHL